MEEQTKTNLKLVPISSLILKRDTYLSGSKGENTALNSEQFRRQSRMSFFRNEKLAERISRDQSLKKVKASDHLGILSVMDDRQKKGKQGKLESKEKLGRKKGGLIQDVSEEGEDDLDSYLEKNKNLLKRNQDQLENYLDLQSSILTKKMKDYDVSKMVIKDSNAQKPSEVLRKELLTNNTSVSNQNRVFLEKEIEKKRRLFMTEKDKEEETKQPTAKFIAQRNTRYDNNLTDSSQIPELRSKIRKKQGMNLIKSNSMRKYKFMDTNQLIEDADEQMTNFQDITIDETEIQSEMDKTNSVIIQNKLNEYMSRKTETSFSRRQPRATEETTLGSIMDLTNDTARGRFLTLNQKGGGTLGNYQIIQNQFMTNKPSQIEENPGESQYLRDAVGDVDAVKNEWETRIQEEGVEMGEILLNENGQLKSQREEGFNEKVDKLREEQKLNELEFKRAKRNPDHDNLVRREDLSVEMNKSIGSELFDENTPKKEKSGKSPELLIILDEKPVRKRVFRLGKNRKKTPKKVRKSQEIPEVETQNEEKSMKKVEKEKDLSQKNVKNIDIQMPKEEPKDVPKAVELNIDFGSKKIFFD